MDLATLVVGGTEVVFRHREILVLAVGIPRCGGECLGGLIIRR